MRGIALTSLWAVVALLTSLSPVTQASEIAAYYDGDTSAWPIPAGKLDYLIYAFGEPDDQGLCAAVTHAQSDIFFLLREHRQLYPGLKLLVSIGGWGQAPQYSYLALTPASRAAFVQSCIREFIVEQGFDGLDLDWEFPVHGGLNKSRPEDKADVTALVQELRRQLDAQGEKDHRHYYLTAAVPAGTWQQGGAYSVSDSYDLAALAKTLDWLNVMTYDMNNIYSPVTGFNAPLAADLHDPTPEPQRSRDNLTGAVQYFEAQGVPADKIMLGVAFYGRGFTGAAPLHDGLYSKYTGGYDETTWKAVSQEFMPDPDWQRHWSDTAEAPWLYDAKTQTFFSYDNPKSMGIKAKFISQQHLKGAVIWELGQDDPKDSLLDALSKNLSP